MHDHTHDSRHLRDAASGLFVPDHYGELIREAVPQYDEYQAVIAEHASAPERVGRILDLGLGTAETSLRVLERHGDAIVDGVDESASMLEAAAARLGNNAGEMIEGSFGDVVPNGPYDVVVASLTIHHLPHPQKRELYQRIRERLVPAGRFVQGDIHTEGPRSVRFPPEDLPAAIGDMVSWMRDAGFARVEEVARLGDVCVIVADAPA